MKAEILQHLPADFPWQDNILYFDSIDSTNTYAKKLAIEGASHGTVVIAGMQTAGRGRMGRSFHSPEDSGVYMSVILRPNCYAADLMHLTCAVGVTMCDAIEETIHLRPGIKWINDLIVDNKKTGGILTELSLAANGTVDHAIVGIGINCNQSMDSFPQELKNIATSLSAATGCPVSRSALAAAMIRKLYEMDSKLFCNRQQIMEQYNRNCVTLQKEIVLHTAQGVRSGYAYGIDNDGALLVRFPDGHTEAVSSGEASVRGMYGYA